MLIAISPMVYSAAIKAVFFILIIIMALEEPFDTGEKPVGLASIESPADELVLGGE